MTAPGYVLTIRAFVPADPANVRQIASAAALLDSLQEQLAAIGLPGAEVEHRFIARHRSRPGSPAAAPTAVTDAPTPGLFTEAAAAPATAAAATTEGGDATSTGIRSGASFESTDRSSPTLASNAAPAGEPIAAGGGACVHQRRSRYAKGDFCLDCQAGPLPAGEAA